MIRLNVKIPKEFVRVIIQDRFWVVYIPFVCMVKFKFLVQFLVDHLAHPVVSSLILFLWKFAAFAYYVIDFFVSFTPWPKTFIEFIFFPFLFSGYFRSVDPCVVSTVSGGCNQSSSALFLNVFFGSLYRCVAIVFTAGKSSSSLSWRIYSVNVISGM